MSFFKHKEEEKVKVAEDFDWRDLPDDVWVRLCARLEPAPLSALHRQSVTSEATTSRITRLEKGRATECLLHRGSRSPAMKPILDS